MRFGAILLLSASVAACSSGVPGSCNSDTDCKPGSKCDPSRNVCVVPNGGCFPACVGGQICVNAKCQSSECDPPCNSSESCDTTTATCKPVTTPTVAITSPAANSFAGLSLQATADARAPGGVNGVDFQVRTSGTTTVLAHAAGAATTQGGANYAATVLLNTGSIPEGGADLVAVMSYPSGSLDSAPLHITIDLTPPTISGGTSTPTFLGPAAPNATVTVNIADSSAGVDPASVKLTLTDVTHAPYAGAVSSGNTYSFTVPMADLGVASGNQGTVHFKIDASDLVGNAAPSYSGQAFEKIQVDLVSPTVSIDADSTWYAASQTATITGSASDAESGISGGAAGVVLTGGTFSQSGTLGASTYSINADFSTQSIGATEAAFPITVTLTDAAGNTKAATGSRNVDNRAPQISGISVTTAPDCAAATCGHDFFRAGAGTVTVTATIVDSGAGVDAATVFLKPAATGANTSFTPVAGVAGGSNSWSFTLPRSVGNSPVDGSAPVQFVIAANDTLASASIPDAAAHKAASAAVSIYFDDVPPTVTKAIDAKWYARKSSGNDVNVTVHATIADAGAGIKSASLTVTDANTATPHTVAGVAGAAGDFTFTLDAAYLLANTEGPLAFALTAQDNLSTGPTDNHHVTTVTDSRNVDGLAPTVTITKIINNSATTVVHAADQLAYPDTVANTGYDGAHFLYSDTVHITGTITDTGAGIAVSGSSPSFVLNGINADSTRTGSAAGPSIAITTCTDGSSSCNFSADVKLSDLTKVGAFHAFDSTLQLVVSSADKAVDSSGSPAGNSGSSAPVAPATTRLWWKHTISGGGAVSGLAIHPGGDAIATTASLSGDTVFALYHDGPFDAAAVSGNPEHWHKGASFYGVGSDLGEIDGAPAIGATGTIYVATAGSDLVALDSSGSAVWSCGSGALGAFHYTPAIATFAKLGSQTSCEGPVAAADDTNLYAACKNGSACVSKGTLVPSSSSPAAGTSPAIVSGSTYYVGATTQMGQATISSTSGVFNAAVSFPSTPASNSWTQLAFGAGQFYGVNPATGGSRVYEFESNLHSTWDNTTISHAINGQPVVEPSNGGVILNTNTDKVLHSLAVSTGTDSTLKTLASAGQTPLLGSDGRIYTAAGSTLTAINETASFPTEWTTSAAAANFVVAPTIDCNGTLFAAAGAVVYAFVTDARGLRDQSPWPKYQRDTRNSGNADASTLWGANVGGTCTQ